MTGIQILLLVGVLVVTAAYITRGRSPWRDRIVVLLLFGGLVVAVVFPDSTSWLATKLGVGRGVDLAFYVGFLLLFLLVGMQRARMREQSRTISRIVREMALLRARVDGADTSSSGTAARNDS